MSKQLLTTSLMLPRSLNIKAAKDLPRLGSELILAQEKAEVLMRTIAGVKEQQNIIERKLQPYVEKSINNKIQLAV